MAGAPCVTTKHTKLTKTLQSSERALVLVVSWWPISALPKLHPFRVEFYAAGCRRAPSASLGKGGSMNRSTALAATLSLCALLVAGCSDDDDDDAVPTRTPSAVPTATATAGGNHPPGLAGGPAQAGVLGTHRLRSVT